MPRVNIEHMLSSVRHTSQVINGEAKEVGSRKLSIVPNDNDEPKQYIIPPGPLRQLDVNKLDTKQQVMEQLNALVPLNKYNLPEYIYRADLIDHGIMLDAIRTLRDDPSKDVATRISDMLSAATVMLDYTEGYPRYDQEPLWKRLPFESDDAYAALEAYISLGGVRQITALISFAVTDVRNWFHMYMWAYRVRSFDMYVLAHHQKLRIQRALTTEDSHYRMAEGLLKRLMQKVQEKTEAGLDFFENISPKDAVLMMEKLSKIQRLSAGLNSGDRSSLETPASPTVEGLMEQIAGPSMHNEDEGHNLTEEIMNNPEALEAAQELALALQGGEK